jgi:hypothetical protein
MIENEMGYRGSKSEIKEFSTVKFISVKEKRVDGSCSGISPRLRCTLMGFERYYQISIPSNQIILRQVKSPRLKRCFHTHSNRLFLAYNYETHILPPSKLDP